MPNDIVKEVRINYSLTGLNTATAKVRKFNAANRQMVTEVKKWDKVHGWRTQSVQIKEMQSNMQKAGGAVKGLAMRFVGLQAALSFAMQKGREVIKWVQDSVTEFRRFEKNMAEVSTIIMDMSRGSIFQLSAGIQKLSIDFGKSANDLAQGMYDILSAAIPAEHGLDLLETATKAATAGLTDVGTSVDVFTSILNAWGLEVSQASQISDQLFQTVVRGKLRFEDLASAMGYIAPIAANLGVEFKEVAAALSTVTRQGQHVDMATRGLALGLQNIADITPKAAAAARKYEVDLSAVALRVGGLDTILADLNRAMNENGTKILPEMISNMRSLRVFMALAGSEGIEGFRTDLDLLNESAGRTEEAMNKMMRTSQFAADVLGQQMKMLERSIGEAWSGFDLWWKKTQLWWGTFLSGGDADTAVKTYERRINDIAIQSAQLIGIQAEILGATPISKILGDFDASQFDSFSSAVDGLTKTLSKEINVEGIKEFFGLKTEELGLMQNIGKFNEMRIELDGVGASLKNLLLEYGNIQDVPTSELDALSDILHDLGYTFDITTTSADSFYNSLMDIKPVGKGEILPPEMILGASKLSSVVASLKVNIEDWKLELKDVQSELAMWKGSEEELRAAIEGAGNAINDHKMNIMELDMEIKNLSRDVKDAYVTIGGATFEGVAKWELATSAAATQVDRFSRYSSMAIKYGLELNTSFMDGIKGLDGYSDAFDEVGEYLDYYNSNIWEATKSNTGYNGSIEDLIEAMRNYSEEHDELQSEAKETKKELDALHLAMKRNNLEIMKIELKGMMRRRGLTRAEEKKIHKIKIENAEHRIKIMENEVSEEQRELDDNIEYTKSKYDELTDIYNEYVDRLKFDLWELKDARNSDLADLIDNIAWKEKNLRKYTNWREEEYKKLEKAQRDFQATLAVIASDDELAAAYEDMFGIDALELAKKSLKEYMEMLAEAEMIEEQPKKEKKKSSSKKKKVIPDIDYTNPKEVVKEVQKAPTPDRKRDIWMEGFKQSRGFQGGTHYVPETRPYLLHRGEKVTPAGKDSGDGTINVTISNHVTIKSDMDAQRFAAMQAEAIQAKLGSKKSGKSKFRMR